MALSVVDLYSRVLPRTNCKDCGFPTCIAFAGMVVSQMHPLKSCPHIAPDVLAEAEAELAQQYKEGKWLKKDMAQEALTLAREKTASMELADIARRIGGRMEGAKMRLPYCRGELIVSPKGEIAMEGRGLSRNEQTFIHIHMAMGGNQNPTGRMKSFKEFPNTVSKMTSMKNHVENPLGKVFTGRADDLDAACDRAGAINRGGAYSSADRAWEFKIFPKISVVLLFWDARDEFEAQVKLLFDETIVHHLDVESIMFLCEHLKQQLT